MSKSKWLLLIWVTALFGDFIFLRGKGALLPLQHYDDDNLPFGLSVIVNTLDSSQTQKQNEVEPEYYANTTRTSHDASQLERIASNHSVCRLSEDFSDKCSVSPGHSTSSTPRTEHLSDKDKRQLSGKITLLATPNSCHSVLIVDSYEFVSDNSSSIVVERSFYRNTTSYLRGEWLDVRINSPR